MLLVYELLIFQLNNLQLLNGIKSKVYSCFLFNKIKILGRMYNNC